MVIDIAGLSFYSSAMTIPRIIHQTWKSEDLPHTFRTFQETWRRHHPGWEYRFYDDAACRRIVEEGFPELIPLYDSCPHPVQRADIFRYLVVALRGGLYADMDMECLRNAGPLLEGKRAVFCVEDLLSPRQVQLLNLHHPERIANFIFAAEADHPVFDKIVDRLKGLPGKWDLQEEVLETTGPGMLTNVIQENRDLPGLAILPRICWAPPTWCYPNCFPFNLHMYARHHFAGTWKNTMGTGGKRGGKPLSALQRWDLREICYMLPPSPVWKSDFCCWQRKDGRL